MKHGEFDALSYEWMDPFQCYLHLSDHLGEGRAFLLDAEQDTDSPAYQMSLIGTLPIAEIQVKHHVVTLWVMNAVHEFVRAALETAGYSTQEDIEPVARSVISGPPLNYVVKDPLGLLEAFRISIQSMRKESQTAPFTSGLFGYIGYDAVRYLEAMPNSTVDDRCLPDIRLQWFGVVIQMNGRNMRVHDESDFMAAVSDRPSFESFQRDVQSVRDLLSSSEMRQVRQLPASYDGPVSFTEEPTQAVYEASVDRALEYIRAGDIFQVVLSKRVRVEKSQHPYVAYDRLRRLNPSPYMFMVEYPDMRLFGASPEVQFRVVDGIAEMKPIAGTSKGRGKTKVEDDAMRDALLSDEKELAEHVMLVDLCRNDLGRVCKTGSVHVLEFLRVEPYVHLFHLVSKVTGELRNDVTVFHALVTTFPAGTLSGAPKIRAMEIIDALETVRRGPYGGLIGVIDFRGNANTAIVIRTVVDVEEGYDVQVGAGVVADSQPTQEWLECNRKARAVLQVLGVTSETVMTQST